MHINSLHPEEIKQILEKNNIKGYRASQIFNWLHKQLVTDFSKMTNISKEIREKLPQIFEIVTPKIVKVKKSSDGTRKYLLELEDGSNIETVMIKNTDKRKTVCVSTQVGCPLACQICATGKIGFKRNLTAEEIIAQVELVYKDNTKVTKVTTEEYKSDIGKDYPTEEKDIFDFLGIVYIEPENRQSGAVLQKK